MTDSQITIRLAIPADAAALAELAATTFVDTFAADNDPADLALHLATAYGRAQQERELTSSEMTTLVAEGETGLAAYAQLRRGPAPACVTGDAPLELLRFYVGRAWHGQGLAHRLMDRVDAEARRLGARTLWLGVFERNARAQAFYRKSGFIGVGSQVFTVGTDPQNDIVMQRAVRDVIGT